VKYWLIKSGLHEYPLDDFERDKKALWVGVRNHLAKKHLMAMSKGDQALFYHSQSDPSAVVGLAKVSVEALPDPTQFEKGDYFEPRATKDKPVWFAPEFAFVKRFKHSLSLGEVKKVTALSEMVLLKASRLSVQPVTKEEFEVILEMCND
jgi:predicted RNA-binding protein with PUA-like domain